MCLGVSTEVTRNMTYSHIYMIVEPIQEIRYNNQSLPQHLYSREVYIHIIISSDFVKIVHSIVTDKQMERYKTII